MKNSKTSNLVFTIDVEDFKNNEQILDALASAIQTSLKLNSDKKNLFILCEIKQMALILI